jgi:hypothetical protein
MMDEQPQINPQTVTNLPQIQNREHKDKKKKLWIKIFVILVVIVFGGSAIGFGYGNFANPSQKEDKSAIQVSGYTFYALPQGTFATLVTLGGKQIPIEFRLDPRNAKDIYLSDGAVNSLATATKAYIVFDPNQQDLGYFGVASAEISRVLSLYNIPTVGAFLRDSSPVNPTVPIKTCADAAQTTTVITLALANYTSISYDSNCVHIAGKTVNDLILAADKLGMHLLGIRL